VGKLGGVIYERERGMGIVIAVKITLVVYVAWRLWCMILAAKTVYALARS
jgi:hypothetical protein